MIRVFVDANVFFAASHSRRGYSRRGSSRALLLAALEGKVEIVASRYVLTEAQRNPARKAPDALPVFEQLIELLSVERVDKPSREAIERVAEYTALKDAPVVAAALAAQVDYLATWDRRHLIENTHVAKQSGLKIVTPDDLIDQAGL